MNNKAINDSAFEGCEELRRSRRVLSTSATQLLRKQNPFNLTRKSTYLGGFKGLSPQGI